MKKVDVKSAYIIIWFLITLVLPFVIPSISYAAETLTITAVKTVTRGKEEITYHSTVPINAAKNSTTCKGTENDPIVFGLKYDEVIIKYDREEAFSFPFHFRILRDGDKYIGKYLIDVKYEEKLVIFTLIGRSSMIDAYSVTPAKKDRGESYVQAGAVYDKNFDVMGFTSPLYKIVSTERLNDGNWWYVEGVISEVLGNTHLQAGSNMYDNAATYPSAYVFCATDNVSEAQAYWFDDAQIGAKLYMKVDGEDHQYTIDGNQSAERINLRSGTNVKSITYAFYGTTSEVLDEQKAGWVEGMVSKVLISIGDLFWDVLQKIGGSTLNISSIIFNEYEPVIVDYFSPPKEGRGEYLPVINSVVNGWYSAFQVFSGIILVVILVAIGVKSILLAGSEQQSKIYKMISGWFMAVVIFYFGPYLMKYAIEVNDALVKILRDHSEYSMYSVYNLDFAEYLDIDFQRGENSMTYFMEQLEAKQVEVSGEVAELERQLEDFKNREARLDGVYYNVADSFDDFLSHSYPTYAAEIRGVPPNDRPIILTPDGEQISYIQTKARIKRLVRNGSTADLATSKVFDKISYKGVTYGGLGTLPKDTLQGYAQVQKEYFDAKEKLKNIERAINVLKKNIDLTATMRDRADKTQRLMFVAIWYLLTYQLVLLMILYYKRLLTVAVLIIIFPLVVMFYAFEKFMGIDKPKAMRTWIIEYTVNIFVQSVHALVYLVLVETGLKIFEADADNWLIFVFAVMAIFPMEAIIKSILGMKSSTVRDLGQSAKTGAAALAAAGAVMHAGGRYKDIKNKDEAKEKKIQQKNEKADAKEAKKLAKLNHRDMQNAARGGNTSEAAARIQQRNEEAKQKAAQREEARKKAAKRRKAMRYAKYGIQAVRNVNAKMNAITTGLAGGGDPQDFIAGAAVAGMMAGSTRVVPKLDDKDKAKTDGEAKANVNTNLGQGAGTNTQNANNAQSTNGATPVLTDGGRAAENARAAADAAAAAAEVDYGNGRNTPTAREARNAEKAERKQSKVQDAFRDKMAAKQEMINATDDYTIIEHDV